MTDCRGGAGLASSRYSDDEHDPESGGGTGDERISEGALKAVRESVNGKKPLQLQPVTGRKLQRFRVHPKFCIDAGKR